MMIQLVMDYYSEPSVTVQKRLVLQLSQSTSYTWEYKNILLLNMSPHYQGMKFTHALLKESFIVNDSNFDSKSVRLSNMWILYCGITSGQCKTLRHYLTTYGKPYHYIPPTTSTTSSTDLQVISEKMTDPYQQRTDQRISNTETISQDILKDPVKVLYLFQCFQEAQDNVLCEILSKSFDYGVIEINNRILLPHQVLSLGLFLSRSHRKWEELNLYDCHIGDHGMSILHQYLCGDKANKQEITKLILVIMASLEHHHISLLTSSVTFNHIL